MKYYIILFSILLFLLDAIQGQATPELENLFERCVKETNVDPKIAFQARAHDLSFDDPKGNCFLKCICTNAGFCDKDLKLVTSFLEHGTDINKQKIRQAGQKCSSLQANNDCDTIFQRFKCFIANVPETPVH